MSLVRFGHARRPRGLATAIAILVLAIAVVIAFSLCDTASQVMSQSSGDTLGDRARLAAESGVCDAMAQLKTSSSWNAGFTGKAMPTDTDLSYTVRVTNNLSGSTAVTAPDGTSVPQGLVYLDSSGSVKTVTRKACVMVQVAGGANPFDYAIFSANSLPDQIDIGNGALVNSYDSSVSPPVYGSQALVGTNGNILLKNQAVIQGDTVAVGTVSGGTTTGSNKTLTSPVTWADVTFTPPPSSGDVSVTSTTATLGPGSYGSVTLNNNTRLTLSAGTYYLTDLSLSNGSALVLSSGPVIVYMSGTLTVINNATMNATGRPQNLQFYSSYVSQATDKNPGVLLNNNGVVNCTVYAPHAWADLENNAQFSGSLLAGWADVANNCTVHYDVSLQSQSSQIGGGASTVSVLSWDLH